MRRLDEEGKAPAVVITATVERQPGSDLSCFYNTMVAGLKHLQHPSAPPNQQSLREAIATYMLKPEAADIFIGAATKAHTKMREARKAKLTAARKEKIATARKRQPKRKRSRSSRATMHRMETRVMRGRVVRDVTDV